MIPSKFTSVNLLLLLVLLSGIAKSQTCSGSLGDPVVNIDFGRGASIIGPSIGNTTNYNYSGTVSPSDGSYTIAKNTAGMNSGWYDIRNHTLGDPNGYMMVVNASETPGIFYETEAPIKLCSNTTYEFAAWIINILNRDGKKPNITFTILTPGNDVIKSYNTGDIDNQDPTWKKYGFLFETTISSQVKLRIENNGPGGNGNDIALDDITFRACGPEISASIDNNSSNPIKNICEGNNASFNLSASINGSATLKYQWQLNKNNTGWNDIPNQTNITLPVSFTNAAKGTYQYRLSAAEPDNFDSERCRTASPVLTVNVNPIPEPKIEEAFTVCLGGSISLDVNFSNGRYAWTGPGGYKSSQKSPMLTNVTGSMAGIYRVTVTSTSGCSATTQTALKVIPAVKASVTDSVINICKGSSVKLGASGGTIFKWLPSNDLSNTDIADPIASPSKTTTYTVTVSNGICEETKQVKVIVNDLPEATAGNNMEISEGESVTLEGAAKGDSIIYYWSSDDGSLELNKLNPTVAPTKNTTYTFTVFSEVGCGQATAQTFIKVYQKVFIPNSFTPNGDDINDTWRINKIDTYESPEVKVMNRYGKLIFESIGYAKPWDGKYKGEDVPAGVYYYLINLNSRLKSISGSLTVLR